MNHKPAMPMHASKKKPIANAKSSDTKYASSVHGPGSGSNTCRNRKKSSPYGNAVVAIYASLGRRDYDSKYQSMSIGCSRYFLRLPSRMSRAMPVARPGCWRTYG